MSDRLEHVLAGILSSVKSGKVNVRVNDRTEYSLEALDNNISVNMPADHLFSRHGLTLKEKLTDLRMLKKLSTILRDSSIRVEVFMDNRKVFSMGQGVSSLLGSEKVNFLNILRSSSKR